MLTDIEMMTISNLDFLHYMTAVSHEMSDEPNLFRLYVIPTAHHAMRTPASMRY